VSGGGGFGSCELAQRAVDQLGSGGSANCFCRKSGFAEEFAARWKKWGFPKRRAFQTKLELGLAMIRRAKQRGFAV